MQSSRSDPAPASDPVGMVLAQQIEERASEALARRLMNRYEEDRYLRSVRLREVGLASTRRCYALRLDPGKQDDEAALAEWASLANNLGYWLSALGRREEALAATEEAVQLRRTLAAVRPDAFLPEFATSLNNLGIDLSAPTAGASPTKEHKLHGQLREVYL